MNELLGSPGWRLTTPEFSVSTIYLHEYMGRTMLLQQCPLLVYRQ